MRKTISVFLLLTTFFASANTSLIDSKSTLESKVQLLLDREEISQTITNYGLSFDQLDWKLHRSVFTDEIQMDFSASIGDGLSTMQADDWVNGVKGFFHNLNATQHIAAPLTISINNDTAYVRSMLHAQHFLPNSKGDSVQTMIGYYDNYLVRTPSGWKIEKMVQHISWNQGNWYVFEKAAGISK